MEMNAQRITEETNQVVVIGYIFRTLMIQLFATIFSHLTFFFLAFANKYPSPNYQLSHVYFSFKHTKEATIGIWILFFLRFDIQVKCLICENVCYFFRCTVCLCVCYMFFIRM